MMRHHLLLGHSHGQVQRHQTVAACHKKAAPTFVTTLLSEGNADPSLEGKYDYNNVKG
jgi:hypothetical protein